MDKTLSISIPHKHILLQADKKFRILHLPDRFSYRIRCGCYSLFGFVLMKYEIGVRELSDAYFLCFYVPAKRMRFLRRFLMFHISLTKIGK